jgi:hypothetical protein
VLLIAFLVLADLLLELLLKLLPLIVLPKTLVLVLLYLALDTFNLLVQLLGLLSQLTHEAGESEVPLFSLDEVSDQLIDVLGACGLGYPGEGLLVLD